MPDQQISPFSGPRIVPEDFKSNKGAAQKLVRPRARKRDLTRSSLANASDDVGVEGVGLKANQLRQAGQGESLTQTRQKTEGTPEQFMAAWDTLHPSYQKPTGGAGEAANDPVRNAVREKIRGLLDENGNLPEKYRDNLKLKLAQAHAEGRALGPDDIGQDRFTSQPAPVKQSAELMPYLKNQTPGEFEQTGMIPAPLDPEQAAAETLAPDFHGNREQAMDWAQKASRSGWSLPFKSVGELVSKATNPGGIDAVRAGVTHEMEKRIGRSLNEREMRDVEQSVGGYLEQIGNVATAIVTGGATAAGATAGRLLADEALNAYPYAGHALQTLLDPNATPEDRKAAILEGALSSVAGTHAGRSLLGKIASPVTKPLGNVVQKLLGRDTGVQVPEAGVQPAQGAEPTLIDREAFTKQLQSQEGPLEVGKGAIPEQSRIAEPAIPETAPKVEQPSHPVIPDNSQGVKEPSHLDRVEKLNQNPQPKDYPPQPDKSILSMTDAEFDAYRESVRQWEQDNTPEKILGDRHGEWKKAHDDGTFSDQTNAESQLSDSELRRLYGYGNEGIASLADLKDFQQARTAFVGMSPKEAGSLYASRLINPGKNTLFMRSLADWLGMDRAKAAEFLDAAHAKLKADIGADQADEFLKPYRDAIKASTTAEPSTVPVQEPTVTPEPPQTGAQAVETHPVVESPAPPTVDPAEVPDAVAAANRVTETVRESVGLNGHPGVVPETIESWAKGASEKGYDTVEGAAKIASEVLDGTKKILTDEETVGISSALAKLLKKHKELGKAYLATAEKGGDPLLADQLQEVTDQINNLTTATNRAGTEWGRSGASRAALVTEDTDVAGVLARRQKAAGRPLTPNEVADVHAQVDELNKVIAEKDARIAELEKGDVGKAQATLDGARKGPRADTKVLDAKIKDAKARLAEKWKKSQPKPMVRSSVFGIDVAAEQLDRLAQVAPELLELSKLGVQKGYTVLAENTKFVVAELKKIGVKDITENDVAAVLAGKASRPKGTTATEYQGLKSEARQVFSQDARRVKEEASLIAQREREIRRSHPPGALRDKEMAAIAADKAKNQAEAKALRDAEKNFWSDVRARERGHQTEAQKSATLARNESRRRFSADPNARLMGSIADLEDKLSVFDAEGIVKGAKSKVVQPKDAKVRALEIREASLKNQFRKIQNDLKAQQEYDQLPPAMKFAQKINPWNASRALVASFDMSFPMNQGALTLFSDPAAWWKGTKDGVRSWVAKGLDKVEAEIAAHPDYDAAKAAGLFEEGSNIADVYGASKFSKIPGISNSERSYEGAANSTRLHLFSAWKNAADGLGGKPMDLADLKKLADEAKTWTGQGVWGKNAQHVSRPFFALRYRLSQIELALGAPLARTGMHWVRTGQSAPFKIVARKYAQAYTAVAATAVILNEGLKHFGPKRPNGDPAVYIDLNPLSTNAGRLVQWHGSTMHTTEILPGPFRIYGLVSRIAAGARITQAGNEDKGQGTSEKMIGEWMVSGAHPLLSQGWALWRASKDKNHEYFGRTLDLTKPEGVGNLLMGFTPISAQTVKDIVYDKNMTPVEKSWALLLSPVVQQSIKDKESKFKDSASAGRISLPVKLKGVKFKTRL